MKADRVKRFLCVCQGGNNRSAGLARTLHDEFGVEAIPIGHIRVSKSTLTYFCKWADYIVAMTTEIGTHIPKQFSKKLRVVDVGEDTYGTPYNELLVKFTREVATDWQKKNWKI